MSLLRAKEICSHYQRHAALMKALCEVNRANYDRILTEWKTAHRRRRNLWTETANFKLPNLDRWGLRKMDL